MLETTRWFLRQQKEYPKKDCREERGCRSNAPVAQVRFDIKPNDPPVFTAQSFDGVEVWV